MPCQGFLLGLLRATQSLPQKLSEWRCCDSRARFCSHQSVSVHAPQIRAHASADLPQNRRRRRRSCRAGAYGCRQRCAYTTCVATRAAHTAQAANRGPQLYAPQVGPTEWSAFPNMQDLEQLDAVLRLAQPRGKRPVRQGAPEAASRRLPPARPLTAPAAPAARRRRGLGRQGVPQHGPRQRPRAPDNCRRKLGRRVAENGTDYTLIIRWGDPGARWLCQQGMLAGAAASVRPGRRPF